MNIQEQNQISFTIGSPTQQIDLKKLAIEVKTSEAKLHQMTQDQTLFTATILQFNRKGLSAFEAKNYQQSLVYIEEAEKILEYVANCGKAIDRALIMMVLHNTACIYQQTQEYKKCLNYLQGIFFNFKTLISNKNKDLSNQEMDIILNAAIYHIQYCAMASQCNKHSNAVKNAQIAMQMLWNTIYNCRNYQLISIPEIQYIYSVLSQPVDLLKVIVGQSILNLKNKTHFSYCPQLSELKQYPINKFLQMRQLRQQDKYTHSNIYFFSAQQKQYIEIIYLAISYFCLANQNRIMAYDNVGLVSIVNQNQLNQAERFHLMCLLILSKFFPLILTLFENTLTLYETHFKCNLIEYYHQHKEQKKPQIEKFIPLYTDQMQFKTLKTLSKKGCSKIQINSDMKVQNKQTLQSIQQPKHKTTIYTHKNQFNTHHKNNHISNAKQSKVKILSGSQKKKTSLKKQVNNHPVSNPPKKVNNNSKSRSKSKKQYNNKKSSPQSTKVKTPTYFKSTMIFSEMKNFQRQQKLKHHPDTGNKHQSSKSKKVEKISPSKPIFFNKHVKGKKSNLSPR